MADLKLVNRESKDRKTSVIPLNRDVIIGRSLQANVFIRDTRISRTHCSIELKKKFVIVRCLSEKNLKVNGILLKKDEERRLELDDIIKFANAADLCWQLKASRETRYKKKVELKSRKEDVIEELQKKIEEIEEKLKTSEKARDSESQVHLRNLVNMNEAVQKEIGTRKEAEQKRKIIEEELHESKNKIAKIEEHLCCPICLDTMNDPILLAACGHMSCSKCLNAWKKLRSICPVCRTRFIKTVNVINVSKLIGEIKSETITLN